MIIFRYICKQLYSYLLAITLVLLIIFITNQFEHYLKSAAAGHITMVAVMQVMSLQVPLLLAYLLPLGFYLSVLLVFGRMYLDNEMTVLSACGLSRAKMIAMVMTFAVILAVFVAWLMLWVEPVVEQYQMDIIQKALTTTSINKIIPKQFQTLGNANVFYAQQVNRHKNQMNDVFLAISHKSGNQQQWDLTYAKHASEVTTASGHFFQFSQGHRTVGVAGENNFQVMSFARYGLRLMPTQMSLHNWPNNVPTAQLLVLAHAKHILKAEGTLQWRYAMPISVIIFALLAIPLSQVNPRGGKFARLLPAIIIYTVYADLIFLGRAWIYNGTISPQLGLWWLHGSFFLLAIILNIQQIGWRRVFRYANS